MPNDAPPGSVTHTKYCIYATRLYNTLNKYCTQQQCFDVVVYYCILPYDTVQNNNEVLLYIYRSTVPLRRYFQHAITTSYQ